MVVKLQVIFAFSKFLQSKLLLFDNKKKAKYINVCVCQLLNCVTLFETPWTIAHQPTLSIGFSKQEQWSGQPFPSPKVFPTQGLNLGLLHCRQTLYHLSHQVSPGEFGFKTATIFSLVPGLACLIGLNHSLPLDMSNCMNICSW